ncbi:uncharacterized protein LOC106673090 [Cimex lectularius]|uniref:Uncharacterized protein n=1 Tax=Cimex lectularius TaxID=79782 RepID=A0A8I6TKW4_CIMLE|nr:uncharacterized protein LOC106673090 [Cimex lectularius]
MDDNIAESSVTSYSSVVIHHSPGKRQNLETEVGEDSVPSRSESYFKVYNNHGKRFKGEEPKFPKPQEYHHVRHAEGDFNPAEAAPETKQKPYRLNFQQSKHIANEGYSSKYNRNRDERQSFRDEDGDHKEEQNREHKFEPSYKPEDPRMLISTFLKQDGPEHRGHPAYRPDVTKNPKPKAHPPPGMSQDLMESLLQKEPQKFGEAEKVKRYEQKKKLKSTRGGESPSSFNVGYSIGFGQPISDDVVFGKPKDVKLHINGQKSVWKQLNEGVEMSQDLEKKKPLLYRIPDSKQRGASPQISVLKNGGSSVFYMNNKIPDINNIPTEGKGTFDHNHALTQSNVFDFSNAMANPPLALPLQSGFAPETQQFSIKPKGRGFDLMNFYQSMGYSAPVPVFIPDSKGQGQMVHAIVIPLQTLTNVDFNWGSFAGMYNNPIPQNSLNFNSFVAPPIPTFNDHFTPSFHGHNFNAPKEKPKTPKSPQRKPKDAEKAGSSFSSSPIVVPPITQSHRPVDLQKEQAALNAILAKELSRKNQRHSPIGLRPPPLHQS